MNTDDLIHLCSSLVSSPRFSGAMRCLRPVACNLYALSCHGYVSEMPQTGGEAILSGAQHKNLCSVLRAGAYDRACLS